MSGSWMYRSWDYHKIHCIAADLQMEDDPLRRVLGDKLHLFARAVREIERVDSGDRVVGADEEFIRKALGEDTDALVLEKVAEDLKDNIQLARELLGKIERKNK